MSIVIPVYNAEQYIGACLASITQQTLGDLEVICVDDGSEDGSAGVVANAAAEDARIKLILQNNGGASSARNVGFDLAVGEFVTFVDADDEISSDFVEVLSRVIERDGSDVALGNTYIIRGDGTAGAKYPGQKETALVRGADYEKYKLLSRNAPHGKLFRRSFLLEQGIRFFEGITYEDYHHWLQTVAQDPKISLVSDFVYTYKRNPHSVSAGAHILRPHNINSRLVQTGESLRVARESNVPGLMAKTFRMQFGARIMRHISALARTRDRRKAEVAFGILREGLIEHQEEIRRSLRGYVRLVYEIIFEGSLEDLRKLLRWGDGKASLALFVDTEPEPPKVYVDPVEFPSMGHRPREFFDVSDKVRKR
ncbi:glycosyltransferase family 2 protein [Nesterenkonia muleiensis]|uniref:glycosyltransferase family 2 protein n=1 Tax=Nesterenkonia muleiensis TaxID=2282648 RepID=UPI00130039E2|nr:glycosyltransferase [Nesterenkonia muleiensis]